MKLKILITAGIVLALLFLIFGTIYYPIQTLILVITIFILFIGYIVSVFIIKQLEKHIDQDEEDNRQEFI